MNNRKVLMFAIALIIVAGSDGWQVLADEPVKVGVFSVDATPPVGTPLAYDPNLGTLHPLSCRGIVLIGKERPIVLCAVDWIAISNEGQTAFRNALAKAAGTDPDRVAVHVLHQHDAPRCDLTTEALLKERGLEGRFYDSPFALEVIARAAAAVKVATEKARPVTHIGLGQAEVERVASNRRIVGIDGKVQYVRFTACTDPKIRAMPAGTIDPLLRAISFWNGDEAVAVLTYYATHPQSYYRKGLCTPDFPGLARDQRQDATTIPHIHFDGAGGNIGAGKWNDGSHENRQALADRMADGMARAWKATVKTPIKPEDVAWRKVPVALPPAAHLDEAALLKTLDDPKQPAVDRASAARKLVWLRRCLKGETIDVTCLVVGRARVLHMPGELFVEYQLAASAVRPDLFVAMAAYGEGAPGYIGTEVAYAQGGYETSERASQVAPGVEKVLINAINQLLRRAFE